MNNITYLESEIHNRDDIINTLGQFMKDYINQREELKLFINSTIYDILISN